MQCIQQGDPRDLMLRWRAMYRDGLQNLSAVPIPDLRNVPDEDAMLMVQVYAFPREILAHKTGNKAFGKHTKAQFERFTDIIKELSTKKYNVGGIVAFTKLVIDMP